MYCIVNIKTGDVVKSEFVLTTSKGYNTFFIGKGIPAYFMWKMTAKYKLWRVFRDYTKDTRHRYGIKNPRNRNAPVLRKEHFVIKYEPSRCGNAVGF